MSLMRCPSIPAWLCVAVGLSLVGASDAFAYESYSGGVGGDCVACHGNFRASTYTSLSDGQVWGNLHNIHRSDMAGGWCETCHRPGTTNAPVYLGRSEGTAGLPTFAAGTNAGLSFGCAGCHGRSRDGASQGNDPTQTSVGWGAGLRQHHWVANRVINTISTRICADCHDDADPANYTAVGEDVLPAFYENPGTIAEIPDDSCNPAGSENFAGAAIGLDNDGDLAYDGSDSDCRAAAGGPGEAAGSGLPWMVVTSHDRLTRNLGLSYGVACGSTDNHLEIGKLDDLRLLGVYDYQTQACGLGASGSATWAYPDTIDALYFLIVGNDGIVEGSYGTRRDGSTLTERPEDSTLLTCANPPLPQDLAGRCDP